MDSFQVHKGQNLVFSSTFSHLNHMFIDAKTLIEQMAASPILKKDGQFSLDLEPLGLKSARAQRIKGLATIQVLSAEAFCFNTPSHMKALGPLWIEGLDQKSQVISAIQDAIYRLSRKLKLETEALRHWGLRDVCIDASESFTQGFYEFQDSRFLYRLLDDQHVLLIAVDETQMENSALGFSLPKGKERQALEQGAKGHYLQHFNKAPPAIVPVLPAFGTGSKPVFERIAHVEAMLADLKDQVEKAESELNSLKSVIAFTPVPVSNQASPQKAVTINKVRDATHTLAHLIAPMNEQVQVNIETSPPEQEFDAPMATVAMNMVEVEAVSPSDFESDHGHMAPTSVTPMLLTPENENILEADGDVDSETHEFEGIKDTVAMDLVGAQNIFIGDATQGEEGAALLRGAAKTDEDVLSVKDNAVEKQVADLLAQAPENDMGGFGKSYTGEHVFDSNSLVHNLNTPASEEMSSEDFESEKSTDAALMVEKDKESQEMPLTGVFDLGDLNEDILDTDARFVNEPPPWRPEETQESLVSKSQGQEDAPSDLSGASDLAFVGGSEVSFSEEVTSHDVIDASAESQGEVNSRVALILKHKKALDKLNEKLKTQIPGLTPAMSCSDLEAYLEREEIRWLIFVRPPKATLSEIQEVKARFAHLKVIVVSNDSQTFGDAFEVDHLLPLVNQVSEVANMIVDILD